MKTLTGTAVLAGAVVLSGCSIDLDGTKHHEERSYTVTGAVTTLKVDSDDGDVEVVGSDSPGVKVVERLTWSSEHRKPKPEHVTEGGTLRLRSRCEGNVIGVSSCGISYRIQVPRGMALDLRNDDGALKVAGLRGTVRLSTDTGSITADNVQTTSLVAKTGDGGIKVSGQAAHTELRTDTGSISAAELRADRLVASTGDGSIRVRLTTPPTDVDARTDTGSVELSVPATEPYKISLSSDTGGRHIVPPLADNSQASRTIKVTTGDGTIRVRPA
ncbi:DUF4097 family beta strand repeat-containing protein [Actinomadura fulvescens]|uniref:DUF4097 family beta strand repeat-containing protein n=1 Tax=Actinomadura fulvescens TaxID=46160 RepID=A0ABN3PQI5_9ACTN